MSTRRTTQRAPPGMSTSEGATSSTSSSSNEPADPTANPYGNFYTPRSSRAAANNSAPANQPAANDPAPENQPAANNPAPTNSPAANNPAPANPAANNPAPPDNIPAANNPATTTTTTNNRVINNFSDPSPYLDDTDNPTAFRKWIEAVRKIYNQDKSTDVFDFASPKALRNIEMAVRSTPKYEALINNGWKGFGEWREFEILLVDLFLSDSSIKESMITRFQRINVSGFNQTSKSMQNIVAEMTQIMADESIDPPYLPEKFKGGVEKTLVEEMTYKLKHDPNKMCYGLINLMKLEGGVPKDMDPFITKLLRTAAETEQLNKKKKAMDATGPSEPERGRDSRPHYSSNNQQHSSNDNDANKRPCTNSRDRDGRGYRDNRDYNSSRDTRHNSRDRHDRNRSSTSYKYEWKAGDDYNRCGNKSSKEHTPRSCPHHKHIQSNHNMGIRWRES